MLRSLAAAALLCCACGRIDFGDHAVQPAGDATADTAGSARDASPADGATVQFQDITNPANWETFDLAQLTGSGEAYAGAIFDGRYLYLGGSFFSGTNAVRFDTQADFGSAAAWSTFALGGTGWGGLAYDGSYVYELPYNSNVLTRYDTTQPFTSGSAWQAVAKSIGGLLQSEGGVFDGSAIYVASNVVSRYAVAQPLGSAGSWETFDPSALTPPATDLDCGMFDGRYAYFMPDDQFGTPVRYDTTGPFTAQTSWESVDLLAFDSRYHQLGGAAFDGRYLYTTSSASHLILRYDTTAPFTARASWTELDLPDNCNSTAFDGRYVYFGGDDNPRIYRYDTTADYSSASSWTSFATGTTGVDGMRFDGHYLYLVPGDDGHVSRFAAIAPGSPAPSLPPGHPGTF